MAQNFQDALDKAFPADKPASSGAAPSGGNSRVSAFVRDVGPIAERIGSEIGVDPKILIGQWGLETGWGKSVIPGTNNYGNIKDFRGSGVVARDNMNGSVDKYRAFASPEEFGDHFAGLVSRKYQYDSTIEKAEKEVEQMKQEVEQMKQEAQQRGTASYTTTYSLVFRHAGPLD